MYGTRESFWSESVCCIQREDRVVRRSLFVCKNWNGCDSQITALITALTLTQANKAKAKIDILVGEILIYDLARNLAFTL